MKRFWKSVRIPAVLVSGSLLLALVAGELLVRAFLPQQLITLRPEIYQPVEKLGYKLRPDIDTTVNTGEREVRLITNGGGYRIGKASAGDPNLRVLALGDSFLEALQVDYEETMTGKLENELSRRMNTSVRILNTGRSGYNPNHYLLVARDELAEASYDAVLVFVYLANDVIEERVASYPQREPAIRHSFHWPEQLSRAALVDAVLYPINDFLEERSHLYVLTKDRGRTLLARLGLTAYYFPSVLQVATAEAERWAITADILSDIADVAKQADSSLPILFILIPASYQVNHSDFEWYRATFDIDPKSVDVDQAARLLSAELCVRNLVVIDTTPALRAAASSGGNPMYGSIDKHLSPQGHSVVAANLLPQVLQALKGPPETSDGYGC